MTSFKALAAAVLLSATAATPTFAQALAPGGVTSSDHTLHIRNLRDSGYNPRNDFNPNGTMRAAIQEPGLFAFYYPNLGRSERRRANACCQAVSRLARVEGRVCVGRRRYHLLRRPLRLL
jgi:hypothetical protein